MSSPAFPIRKLTVLGLGALLLLGLGGSGCIRFSRGKKNGAAAAIPAAPPAAPMADAEGAAPRPQPRSIHFAAEGRVGTVRLVGRGGKFVLVETLNGGLLPLPDGQEMHTRTGGEPGAPLSANLRLSRERRQPFVAADVVDGQPRVGDAVFVGGATEPVGPAAPLLGGLLPPALAPAGTGGLLPAPPPAAGAAR